MEKLLYYHEKKKQGEKVENLIDLKEENQEIK
jgi:hypothetical protein